MAEQKIAGFAVEDMTEGGGGLFDNVRATVIAGRFDKNPPNENYTVEGNPIFAHVDLLLAGDGPAEDRKVNASFSLGQLAGDHFTVSPDGDYLIPSTDESAIRKDCKFGTFAASLQNEGVPKTILSAFQWSKLVGLDGQFKRIADKERSFADDKKARSGGKPNRPQTTLCLVKLFALPGEQAAGKPNGKATSATAPATTNASTAPAVGSVELTGDLDTDTLTLLSAVIKKNGGSVQRGRLTLAVSKEVGSHPQRADFARRAAEESFLTSMVDAGMLVYAASEKGQPVSLPA